MDHAIIVNKLILVILSSLSDTFAEISFCFEVVYKVYG